MGDLESVDAGNHSPTMLDRFGTKSLGVRGPGCIGRDRQIG